MNCLSVYLSICLSVYQSTNLLIVAFTQPVERREVSCGLTGVERLALMNTIGVGDCKVIHLFYLHYLCI